MFNSTGKVTQVEKLLKSIDESYALMPKEDIANLTYKNADEVKNIIRESYVREVFPELGKSKRWIAGRPTPSNRPAGEMGFQPRSEIF